MNRFKRIALEIGIFWGFMTGERVSPPPGKTWQDGLDQLNLIIGAYNERK